MLFGALFPIIFLVLFNSLFTGGGGPDTTTVEGHTVGAHAYFTAGCRLCPGALLLQHAADGARRAARARAAQAPTGHPPPTWNLSRQSCARSPSPCRRCRDDRDRHRGVRRRPAGADQPGFVIYLFLGTATLSALGIAATALAKNEDSAQPIGAFTVVMLSFVSGIFIQSTLFPTGWRTSAGCSRSTTSPRAADHRRAGPDWHRSQRGRRDRARHWGRRDQDPGEELQVGAAGSRGRLLVRHVTQAHISDRYICGVMELNATGKVILGMLAARPRSGYEIKQLVDSSARFSGPPATASPPGAEAPRQGRPDHRRGPPRGLDSAPSTSSRPRAGRPLAPGSRARRGLRDAGRGAARTLLRRLDRPARTAEIGERAATSRAKAASFARSRRRSRRRGAQRAGRQSRMRAR